MNYVPLSSEVISIEKTFKISNNIDTACEEYGSFNINKNYTETITLIGFGTHTIY